MDLPTSDRGAILREPWLRTDVMIELLGEACAGKVLLVGDAEGLLARRLSREAGADVTWLEPFGGDGSALEAPGGEVRRLCGDPFRLPFGDGEFDAVASQFTICCVPDPHAALLECARVTVPSGPVALACRNEQARGPDPGTARGGGGAFTPGRLGDLMEECGLVLRGVRTLLPDLKLPRLYRGDLSFSLRLARLPWLRERGTLVLASAEKRPEG